MDSRGLALLLLSASTACFDPEAPRLTSDDSTGGTTGGTTETPPVDDTTAAASDTVDTGDPTDCPAGCDDDIDCTDDACVDGACVNTPADTMCDDGIDCTADACDAAMGCTNAPADAMCDDGIDCTRDACDAAMGCTVTPDDTACDDDGVGCTVATCDPDAGCTSAPDDAACDDGVGCTVDVCDPEMDCISMPDDTACDDGLGCTFEACDPVLDCQTMETSILVLNGSGGTPTPENAVANLGFTPIVTTDEASFAAAFDAGGYVAIVHDVPGLYGPVPPGVQTRLDAWVNGGGRLVFGFWELDADAPMRMTLGVNVTASFDTPLPIHPDPASPADLFGMPESISPPISYPDGGWGDNGDQLALAGPGFVAGRFNDPIAGPGAILVTHADHVITNGFMISDAGSSPVDSDGDGIHDAEELLRNELTFICSAP